MFSCYSYLLDCVSFSFSSIFLAGVVFGRLERACSTFTIRHTASFYICIRASFCFQDKDLTLSGEHIREGLTCVISVKVPDPEFEGQTKVLLYLFFFLSFGIFVT